MDLASALCLPKHLCADACDEEESCVGIGVHDELPLCFLYTDCSSTVEELDRQFFTKMMGTACTQFSDFSEKAGAIAVTNRVHVGVDYIATPGEPTSIELTGLPSKSLLPGAGGMLSADRIMVIDCGGTCGIAGPSESVEAPTATVASWSSFWPKTYFREMASEDAQNAVDPERVVNPIPSAKQETYAETYPGYYCSGHNLDLGEYAVPVDGVTRPLVEYGCWEKCSTTCFGDHCKCDGYLSGFDTATSNALCADMATCTALCDNIEDCESVDMHSTINRCFLNGAGCGLGPPDTLLQDAMYSLLVKPTPTGARRLHAHMEAMQSLPVLDIGFSWERMLRFGPIKFASGGTFKLCFCDSALAGSCGSVADYAVEVGTVHASGVSCLLGKPELRRASCTPQFHGGLRCYKSIDAPAPKPPVLLAKALEMKDGDKLLEELSTYCLYQPEEVGCQVVSGYQSTAM